MNDMDLAPCFVCRCEEITRDEIEQAIVSGARTINDVKRRTRAAMGACQGAYCLEHVASLVCERAGVAIERVVPMTMRPPVRWIALATLAGMDEEQSDAEAVT